MRIVASVALTLVLAWSGPAFAQPRPAGFPDVIGALKATPGCLGVELYGPLPGGVAVGGRFAPEALKVRGLREIPLGMVQGQSR